MTEAPEKGCRMVTAEPEIIVSESRIAYKSRYLAVREDKVVYPDGSSGLYSVVEKQDFSLVVPEIRPGYLCMISLYRHPVRERFWEFPQGASPNLGASPEEVAAQELSEETGYTASSLEKIGSIYEAYGNCAARCDIFVGRGLTAGEPSPEASEGIIRTGTFTGPEIWELIHRGAVMDAATVAALGIYSARGCDWPGAVDQPQ
jgi:ADP-ribose pyrophosphatase